MSRTIVFIFALCSGCRCGSGLQAVEPPRLVVRPEVLELSPAYVGQVVTGAVLVINEGGATAEPEVSISAPFEADGARLRLVRGESAALIVRFSPVAPGRASGVLRIGPLEVPIGGDALEVPECRATDVCRVSRFDTAGAVCVETPRPDGTVCETSCLQGGCTAGTCVGQLKGCDDANACTVDACDETTGCSHSPRVCPQPEAPCQVARCDSATGCTLEEAVDGTLCGPDDCLATQVDVCLAGVCVQRPRPTTGRCTNRWVSSTISSRWDFATAYDRARRRMVVFGGQGGGVENLADTWEWDGMVWTPRTPAQSPPAREGHRMVYDEARQRIVLFGGSVGAFGPALADTWEWDGVTWTQRAPPTAPPARARHAMTYDPARQRIVLFGGEAAPGAPMSDTWEWDGRRWTQNTSASAPPARSRHVLGFDEARGRAVLFGGGDINGAFLSDTWEFDGRAWASRAPNAAPSARASAAMAFDVVRRRLVLVGGYGNELRGESWEWDGSTWLERTPSNVPRGLREHGMVWDSSRQRLVVLGHPSAGSFETWEWDGMNWARASRPAPPIRYDFAMAADRARQRIVLWGGISFGTTFVDTDTWEWDGLRWARLTPATSPPARAKHAMAYDAARRRLVLFGGGPPLRDDTWEWDGVTWTERTPATSPPAREEHVMAWDERAQRVVLFGGRDALGYRSDLWEWNGTTWTERVATTAPYSSGAAMASDEDRQRLVVFGGWPGTWEWDGATWDSRDAGSTSPTPRTRPAMAYDETRRRVVLFGGGYRNDTWEWDGTQWSELQPVVSPPASLNSALTFDSVHRRMLVFTGVDTWSLLR